MMGVGTRLINVPSNNIMMGVGTRLINVPSNNNYYDGCGDKVN